MCQTHETVSKGIPSVISNDPWYQLLILFLCVMVLQWLSF